MAAARDTEACQPKRFRLSRGWWFSEGDVEVVLEHPTSGRRLALKGVEPASAELLLDALFAGVSVDLVPERLAEETGLSPEQVRRVVSALEQARLLITEDGERPAVANDPRQEPFFGFFEEPGITAAGCNARLRAASVCIVGLGGYGTWTAELLGRLGVRRLHLYDPDRVEERNMSRQILYTLDDVGGAKAEVAAGRLRRIGRVQEVTASKLRIASADDLAPAIRGCDLVLSEWSWASGEPGPRNPGPAILEACARTGTPVLSYSGSIVGPLTIPGETACPRCAAHTDVEGLRPQREFKPFVRMGVPSVAPRLGLTASVVAWEAMLFLSGAARPTTLDALIHLNPFSWTLKKVPLERSERCSCAARSS
jgi:molybdopterin-synthase adenylyltransferase